MILSIIRKYAFGVIVAFVIASTWQALFVKLHYRTQVAPSDRWNIRVNAIRQMLAKSSEFEYFVIQRNGRQDLLLCGKSTSDAIDQLIHDLGVTKNEVAGQGGYTVPQTWTQMTQEGKWQFQFEPGSVIVEDFVQGLPRYFIVILYSAASGNYVITIDDASEIIQEKN